MAGSRLIVEGLPWYRCVRALSVAPLPDHNAMDGVSTKQLVDRSRFLVTSTNTIYEWDQDSVAVANGTTVIAALDNGANPGRFLLLSTGGGSTLAEFAWAKGGVPAQIGVTAGVNLTMDQNGLMRGITRPGGSQTAWQLTEGKIYQLLASGRFENFSDAVAGNLRIDWVDDNDTVLTSGSPGPDSASGFFFPATSTGAQSSSAVVGPLIYQAGAGDLSVVKLRCTAGTGTADLPQGSWEASIVEIL